MDKPLLWRAVARRNLAGQDFSPRLSADDRQLVVSKLSDALDTVGDWKRLDITDGTSPDVSTVLAAFGLSEPSAQNLSGTSAFVDKGAGLAALVGGEDHLQLAVWGKEPEGLLSRLQKLLSDLSESVFFSHHADHGWLTARPKHAGTGITVGALIHLPVSQVLRSRTDRSPERCERLNLDLIGLSASVRKTPGALLWLFDKASVLSADDAAFDTVRTGASQFLEDEDALRAQALGDNDDSLYADKAFRSLGILNYARQLSLDDFLTHWSRWRTGAHIGMGPLSVDALDDMLLTVLTDLMTSNRASRGDARAARTRRAQLVRHLINGGH